MQEASSLIGNQKLLATLKTINGFRIFSDEDLRSFLDLGRLRRYDSGEMIIMEEESDRWVYFLLSGEVRILKEGQCIQTLQESGALFGEMGMLDGLPRSASIQAKSTTLVLCLDGNLIGRSSNSKRLSFYFTVFRFFARVLTKRLRGAFAENHKLREELQHKENLLKQHARGNDQVIDGGKGKSQVLTTEELEAILHP